MEARGMVRIARRREKAAMIDETSPSISTSTSTTGTSHIIFVNKADLTRS